MDGRRRPVGLPALSIAAGGVLGGHVLTYVALRPDHHDRSALLAATGHGYLGAATELVLLAAAGAVVATLLGRLMRSGTARRFGTLAPRLAAVQVGTFAALEIAERLAAGSFEGLAAVVLLGGAVQVLLAPLGAWLLLRLERAADRAGELLGRVASIAPSGHVGPLATATVPAPAAWTPAGASIRGPPADR